MKLNFLLALCLTGLLPASSVHAQFALTRTVVAGGGGAFTSPDFSLNSTLGQATTGRASGSGFVLATGYWGNAAGAEGLAALSTIAVAVPAYARPLGSLTVDILVGDVVGGQPAVDLYDLNFTVDYDPTRVAFQSGSFSVGGFLDSSGGANSVAQSPMDDPVSGRLSLAVSRTGGAGVTGEGVVASVTFEVLAQAAPGPLTLSLSDVLALDGSGAEIPLTPSHAPTDVLGVWPGDANDDCIVDILDVLPLFHAFGTTGPARQGANDITWVAQGYAPWASPGDASVDGTGDGEIDTQDVLPITANWGENREGLPGSECAARSKAAGGSNGESGFDVEVPVTAVGDSVVVELFTNQVQNELLGIAFELLIPAGLFRVASTTSGSLLDDGDLIVFEHMDPETGLFSAAFGRKGEARQATGAGSLARITLEVVAEMDGPAQLTLPRTVLGHAGGETNSAPAIITQIADPTGTAVDPDTGLPDKFVLKGAYPNPFNPTTTVVFDLPKAAEVTVLVYNLLGREVRRLESGHLPAGANQSMRFEAGGLSSGMYLYRVLVRQGRTLEVLSGSFVLAK